MAFQAGTDTYESSGQPAQTKRIRRKRRRPNWPYRFAWLVLLGSVTIYIVLGTRVSALHEIRFHQHPDLYAAFLARCLDATFGMWFFAVGASIGSFLNVVAYRLPLGRTLGGHSGCPYCCTPIAGSDNVPVLAWLKLRGRCRQCHLPISIQYPLVELGVGLVYLFVFFSEFARAGANLPGVTAHGHGYGVAWTNINAVSAGRTFAFLFLVSGLIAAALIAVKRRTVPMQLYVWLLIPFMLAVFALPGLVVIPWWTDYRTLTDFDVRIDGVVTVICGLVMGVGLARLVAPLLYGNVDRTLSSSDDATNQARQWIGAMGIAGAALGWQSACQVAIVSLLCQWILRRSSIALFVKRVANAESATANALNLSDVTVSVWLGLLLVRANWNWLYALQVETEMPPIAWYLIATAILGALSWQIGKFLQHDLLPSIEQSVQEDELTADGLDEQRPAPELPAPTTLQADDGNQLP